MTDERTFSSLHVYSLAFWLVGLSLAVVHMLTGWDTGPLGVIAAGVGGLINIRTFILHKECHDRELFALGRDVERVTNIR